VARADLELTRFTEQGSTPDKNELKIIKEIYNLTIQRARKALIT